MAKEETTRNKKILKMAKQGIPFAKIAVTYNISRERVRQILKKFGFTDKDFPSVRLHHQGRCFLCGNLFFMSRKSSKFCSQKCSQEYTKSFFPKSCKNYYVSKWFNIYGKRVRKLVHRIVMEEYLGRELDRTEVVHHKNHDRKDNRLENLELMSSKRHGGIHGKETGEIFTFIEGIRSKPVYIKIKRKSLVDS